MLRILRLILSYRRKKLSKIPFRRRERERLVSRKLFEEIERVTIEKKLFLKQGVSLSTMAMEIGTNRTYISNAVRFTCMTFRDYINLLRIKHMLEILKTSKSSGSARKFNAEDIAFACGFSTRRAMNESLMKILGIRYFEIRKRDSEQIEKLSTFVTQKYNYGRRESNIFNERSGEDNSSEQ